MKGSGYTSWFDETYKETYLILRRAGRILLAHLCPALLGDLDELLDCTYNRINYSYSISYNGTIGNEYRVYVKYYAEDDGVSDTKTTTSSALTAK